MIGHIFLVKNENTIVPAVIIEVIEDKILLAQIRSNNRKGKNVIDIGHPVGLKNPSVIMKNKVFTINSKDLVKKISEISIEKAVTIGSECSKHNKQQSLHTELHKLKAEIQRAQFNNQDYRDKEKEVERIIKELGYPEIKKNFANERPFLNYREVPSKGRIKIYYGGRN